MPPRKRKPKLSDVMIARTEEQGPTQVAVWLAKQVALKRNPVKHCVIIVLRENEDPDLNYTELNVEGLETLHSYLGLAIDDIRRELWYDFLAHPPDEDDGR